MVNITMNMVQYYYNKAVVCNRCNNSLTTEQLLEKFNAGLKIDIRPLFSLQNNSKHIEYVPTFIVR
jgi:hypothetical protein